MLRVVFALLLFANDSGVRSLGVSELPGETVPEDWSLCDFLKRLSSHDPFLLRGAVPPALQELSVPRLVELSDEDSVVHAMGSDNGFMGPNNYDHNILMQLPLEDFADLLDGESESAQALRDAGLSIQAAQAALPEKLREFVWSALPSWVPFPAHVTRMWIEVPGHRRGTFFHNDPQDNIYMMLRGTKTFQLIAPWQSHLVKSVEVQRDLGWYLALNDHWRWVASRNISQAHDSWWSMAADSDGVANLSSATRFIVRLKPGDILVMPRGWWHTTFQDGEEAAVAVNLWFDTRNPFSDLWWRSHQDMGSAREQAEPARGAMQSGTWQGLSNKLKHGTFERLRQEITRVLPQARIKFLTDYNDVQEPPLRMASSDRSQGTDRCIRWSFGDMQSLERLLLASLNQEKCEDGDGIAVLLKLLKTRFEDESVWDVLRDAYSSFMGGESWQPLQEWHDKMHIFYKDGVPPLDVHVGRYMYVVGMLQQEIVAQAVNNHTLFGLFGACEESAGLATKIPDSAGKPLPTARITHPCCEAIHRSVFEVLQGSFSCEVACCSARSEPLAKAG